MALEDLVAAGPSGLPLGLNHCSTRVATVEPVVRAAREVRVQQAMADTVSELCVMWKSTSIPRLSSERASPAQVGVDSRTAMMASHSMTLAVPSDSVECFLTGDNA